jgi:hypothetical protein
MKHVGKMKHNGAPVAIVFRTLPGDPHNCLVVGTQGLGDSYHDGLMKLIETPEAQDSYELGQILSVRRFPDNSVMLGYLHVNGRLKKVATKDVLVTPTTTDTVPLDELNNLIAEQKGISLEDLALKDETGNVEVKEVAQVKEMPVEKTVSANVNPDAPTGILDDTALAKNLRSQADAMFKEAQSLRRQADELDPPAKKTSKKTEKV